MQGEDVVHPPGDVPSTGVGRVDQHPAPVHPLGGHQVDERLLLRVEPVLRQGRYLDDDVLGPWIEDRLPPGAAVGVGQERLEVGRQQPLGTILQGVREAQEECVADDVEEG